MRLAERIIKHLTPDLLRKKYGGKHPLSGHCYVASEAYYHLAGGKEKGLEVYRLRIDSEMVHWFLKQDERIIDLTAEQFDFPLDYSKARAGGFLTKAPSKRAQVLMRRVLNDFGAGEN